jgi:cytochrome c553
MDRTLFHRLTSGLRRTALTSLLLLVCAGAQAQTSDAALAAGRRIYEEGVLSSGAALSGRRADGTEVKGSAAACTNCHKRSGMGSVEGDIQVAPISGRFLFPPDGERPLATMDPRIGKRMNIKRDPHTDASLAVAIRTGKGSGGQAISPLMPRYSLSDTDMQALGGYLRQLSVAPSAGVEERTIRFATVLTPGVEPERKRALLDMLRIAFMQKNGSTITGANARRHMVTAAELVLGTENKWVLDIWELKGAPETWKEQLEGYNKLAPPFALLSGISNSTWAPVESFCESQHIPCWFPSVAAAPQDTEQPHYSFYFSKGLTLESDVAAMHLRDTHASGKLVQVVRGSDAGITAANALAKQVGAQIKTEQLDLDQWAEADAAKLLGERLAGLAASDTVMLWLRPADLRLLQAALAQTQAQRYASGTLLGGTASFMPEALRANMRLVYPYEMPQAREANVAYMHVWLKLRKIPLVDEALQSEVYFALNFMTDSTAELLDNLYRDYLVERAENMIGQREARKAEDEMRDQTLVRPRVRSTPMDASIPRPSYAPGMAEHLSGVREGTTVYPRLTLGPGQRYASKGAYIVQYSTTSPGLLLAETPWMVP